MPAHIVGEKWRSSSCRGKVRYKTKKTAEAALRVMIQSGRARTSDRLHIYKCKECRHHHLGNSAGSAVPAPLKRVKASIGDIIEIFWKEQDGRESSFRYMVKAHAENQD